MKYTFLIGNGFDLNLGLKTSFSDFFSEYCKSNDNDSNAVKKLKSEIVSDNIAWSDFELQMGAFTNHVEPDGPLSTADFIECMEDFRNNLVDYLQWQERFLTEATGNYGPDGNFNCVEDIEKFFNFLRPGGKQTLMQFMSNYIKEQIEYRFIVFNYTHTFEYLLSRTYSDRTPRHVVTVDNPTVYTINDSIGPIVHVHGDLDGVILMGVDNEQQVANSALASSEQFKLRYIKPFSNASLEDMQDSQAEALISDSDIIVVYGMSLGQTDSLWWKSVMHWLGKSNANRERYLVIFIYDGKKSKHSPADPLVAQNEVREKLIDYTTGLSKERQAEMKSRILCALNSDFLKF